jgi:DNA (cytosine-5)-methyltransferase 1
MTRPTLLDAYCGAGGAAVGYHRAGFDVVGVDITDQPNYPFRFVKADALQFISACGDLFDAIHASPPCQRYSRMSNCRPGLAEEYPDLIPPTREALKAGRRPYVIENVPGSTVRPDLILCGCMVGLPLYRPRWFESSEFLWQPDHGPHSTPASPAGHWKPGTVISVSGNCAPIAVARAAMGVDWTTRDELSEAIPPAFTEYVGAALIANIREQAA